MTRDHALRRWNWRHSLGELAIVVLGILIALWVNDWAQARRDRGTEGRYLERLRADSTENVELIQKRIDLHRRRADTLTRLSAWMAEGGARPPDAEMSEVLCRWFIQPPLGLRRGTYAELVSTGNLGLLRAVHLRSLLERAEATHRDVAVLDSFDEVLQRATAPLDRYRQWRIAPDSTRGGTACDFDFEGMRSDPAMRSVLAQIYRGETSSLMFRERELAAVRALHEFIGSTRAKP